MKCLRQDAGGNEWVCSKCGFVFGVTHYEKPVFGFEINYCPHCGIAFHKWKPRNKNRPYDGGEKRWPIPSTIERDIRSTADTGVGSRTSKAEAGG